MTAIIKPSSDIRKNYNSVAEICRTQKVPVFLTKNGEGDMVIMDIESYNRREEDLALAQHLASVEMARATGTKDFTLNEFEQNIRKIISTNKK